MAKVYLSKAGEWTEFYDDPVVDEPDIEQVHLIPDDVWAKYTGAQEAAFLARTELEVFFFQRYGFSEDSKRREVSNA